MSKSGKYSESYKKSLRMLQGTAQTPTGTFLWSTQASLSVEPAKEFKQPRGKKKFLLEVLFILSSHKSLRLPS